MNSQRFVEELVAAMPNPQARLVLIAVLAKYAGQTVYIPLESKRERRVRSARHMLSNNMSAAEVAATIAARFRVSQRTAYRDVKTARNMSNESVSAQGQNGTSAP